MFEENHTFQGISLRDTWALVCMKAAIFKIKFQKSAILSD